MQEFTISVVLKFIERGQLKAFADVTYQLSIGELTICGFRVLHKTGEDPWVAYPSSSYMKEGKPQNKPLIEVSRSVRQAITQAILAEYQKEPSSWQSEQQMRAATNLSRS